MKIQNKSLLYSEICVKRYFHFYILSADLIILNIEDMHIYNIHHYVYININ